jgi:hypothetical protein
MDDLLHPDELIQRLRLNRYRCFVITGRARRQDRRLTVGLCYNVANDVEAQTKLGL